MYSTCCQIVGNRVYLPGMSKQIFRFFSSSLVVFARILGRVQAEVWPHRLYSSNYWQLIVHASHNSSESSNRGRLDYSSPIVEAPWQVTKLRIMISPRKWWWKTWCSSTDSFRQSSSIRVYSDTYSSTRPAHQNQILSGSFSCFLHSTDRNVARIRYQAKGEAQNGRKSGVCTASRLFYGNLCAQRASKTASKTVVSHWKGAETWTTFRPYSLLE